MFTISKGFFFSRLFDKEQKYEMKFVELSPRYLPVYQDRIIARTDSGFPPSAGWKLRVKVSNLDVKKSAWTEISTIVPENSLIGTSDVIPGMANSTIEISEDPASNVLQTFNNRETVYLHGLTLKATNGWEAHLHDYVKRFADAKYGGDIQRANAVKITERRVKIQVHNTWQVLPYSEKLVSLTQSGGDDNLVHGGSV